MNFTRVIAAAFCLLPLLPLEAMSQAFPQRTVKIIVPYAPGGGVDAVARMLADRLQQKWGKPVIVENKAGASTIIGAQSVAKAAPDAYPLLLTSEATITSNPYLFDKLPYDAVRELTPISQIVSLPQMVVAHPSVSANTLAELIALAKTSELNYASYGSGSLPHLFFEGLKSRSGIQMIQVPYKGITPAVAAVLAGEVQLTLAGASLTQGHISAGKLKPLAVARQERLAEFPQVPTLREAGFTDVDPRESWFGLFVTGGTPAAVVQKIYQDVAEIGADASFRERFLTGRGLEPVFSSPANFARFIQADMRQKARLIRISGAKAE